jgi:peptidylprolyl isomerase
MAQAKIGDKVLVDYTGKLANGTVFDSSEAHGPLEFTIGEGQVIPGFEEAVVGLSPGESRTVTIPSDQAYGAYRNDLTMEVDQNQFPEDVKPEVGQQLQLQQENMQPIVVTITKVDDGKVTLDANHPLAGEDLTFDIKLDEIAA